MNTIIIKNLSTLSDYSAVARVAAFISGDRHMATHDSYDVEMVKITRKGNTYTVTDKEYPRRAFIPKATLRPGN